MCNNINGLWRYEHKSKYVIISMVYAISKKAFDALPGSVYNWRKLEDNGYVDTLEGYGCIDSIYI